MSFYKAILQKIQQEHEEWVRANRPKTFKECIKHRDIELTDGKQLPEIFHGAMWGNSVNHKTITQAIGKDQGQISRLLQAENMNIKTLLSLCKILKIKVTISGNMYQEE